MGANMARRVQESRFSVGAVYDRNRRAVTSLAQELGCPAAQELSEVTALSDVIITVVDNGDSMFDIFSTEQESLLIQAQGKLFINCATVSPDVQIEVGRRVHQAGALVLEACMASSITQARAGSLYLICGGQREVFEKALPILKVLSPSPRYVGKIGQASTIKALVNMVMNINTSGLAEGLALGDALGIDLTLLREIFAQTGAASRVLETDGEDMQKRDHACFFSAAHAAKDSGIAIQLAEKAELNLPLARATKEQYDRMVREGLGELDKSGIAELTFKGRSS